MTEDDTTTLLKPLALLSPSPTNPRKRINEAAMQSLAESIAQHGVMAPVVARRLPNAANGQAPYEIVAGHRRWQACVRLAQEGRSPHGDSIPTLVHQLTDAQVLAMQLVENLQRDDLHPLDEAAHYRRMRDDPTAPATVEDIALAGKVGVSRVYERLSLLNLVDAAREAFLAEKLNLKTALQVARLPPAHQAEVAQHLSDWGGEPMTPKAAQAFIRDRYMLRLSTAQFDVTSADLLPDTPACGVCPKRTGANPQLFGDISDADTCTDTTCFAAKKAAQRARQVDELKVSGFTIVQGDYARAVCSADGRDVKEGRHLLEAAVPFHLGNPKLKVVDVLTEARAPNEVTEVIDHPGSPVLIYAVTTPELERHLKKLKQHRMQLDKAAEKAAPKTPAAPAAAPPAAPAPAAAPAEPGSPSGDQEAAQAAEAELAHEGLVRQLLAFTPPATVAGKYRGMSAERYEAEQVRRARGILAAAEVARTMARDQAEGLPPFKLAQMLCVQLWYSESHLSLQELCLLTNVPWPGPARYGMKGADTEMHWLWQLPDDQAERLAMAWLAAQEDQGDTPFAYFAETVCRGLNIPVAPLWATAEASVREHLQLGALQNGTPAEKPKAKGKAPAVKYRCPATGSTWSGRGLKPVWLKVALAEGKELASFEVHA